MWRRTMEAWVFCDGALAQVGPRGQVTAAGAAALLRSRTGQILAWDWRRLPAMTNNEAEYAGLLLGLELARRHGVTVAHCLLDSEVVVGQMQGRFGVHSAALRRWHEQAVMVARAFQRVTFTAIAREQNRLADALANEALSEWQVEAW